MSRLSKNPELMMQLSVLLDQGVDADDPRLLQIREQLNVKTPDSKGKPIKNSSPHNFSATESTKVKIKTAKIKPSMRASEKKSTLLRENHSATSIHSNSYSSSNKWENNSSNQPHKDTLKSSNYEDNVLKVNDLIIANTEAREWIDYELNYVKVNSGYCQIALPVSDVSTWNDDIYFYSLINLLRCGMTKKSCANILHIDQSTIVRILHRFHYDDDDDDDDNVYHYCVTDKLTNRVYLTCTASDAEYLIMKILLDKSYMPYVISITLLRSSPVETSRVSISHGIYKYSLEPNHYTYSVRKGIGYETQECS